MDPEKFTSNTTKAIVSQFLGFFFDAYDLTMILGIAPLLAVVILPPASPLIASFEVILSYSLTIIFRPVGSAIFGHYGDKLGRRNTLIITILGMGIASALTSALPTYAQVGILSYILFVLIRIVVGIFAGGEYSAGHPFVMEWTPSKWRGLISGLVQGGFAVGAALAGTVEGAFIAIFGVEAMETYAWRYLFLTTLIAAVIALIVRIYTPETPVFEDVKKKGLVRKTPLFDLFKKPYVYDFLQVMLYMTGLFFYAYVLFAFVPTILENPPSAFVSNSAEATFIYSLGTWSAFVGDVVFGALSQYIGRRRLTIYWAIATFIIAIPIYYLLISSAEAGNVPLASLVSIILGFVAQAPWGIVPVYLSERFKASMRASGVGFGYSSGIFIGGWFSIYVPLMHQYLFKSIDTPTNVWFSTAVLLMIGAVLIGVGQYIGPETVGTKLTEEVTPENSMQIQKK